MESCHFSEHHFIHLQKSKGGAMDVAQLLGCLPSNRGLAKEALCSVPGCGCHLSIEEVEIKRVSSRHNLVTKRLSQLVCMRPLFITSRKQERKQNKPSHFIMLINRLHFTRMSCNEDFFYYISFICVYVVAHVEVRTRCRSQFSILWVLGVKLGTKPLTGYITLPTL